MTAYLLAGLGISAGILGLVAYLYGNRIGHFTAVGYFHAYATELLKRGRAREAECVVAALEGYLGYERAHRHRRRVKRST